MNDSHNDFFSIFKHDSTSLFGSLLKAKMLLLTWSIIAIEMTKYEIGWIRSLFNRIENKMNPISSVISNDQVLERFSESKANKNLTYIYVSTNVHKVLGRNKTILWALLGFFLFSFPLNARRNFATPIDSDIQFGSISKIEKENKIIWNKTEDYFWFKTFKPEILILMHKQWIT